MNPCHRTSNAHPRRAPQPAATPARHGSALVLAFLAATTARGATLPLRCEEAVARALAVSHLTAAADHAAEAAAAAVVAADAARLPILAAAATLAERSSVPEYRLPLAVDGQPGPILVPDVRTTYQTSLSAHQPLYAGGAMDARRHAARAEAVAATADRAVTASRVRLETRAAYWRASAAQAHVRAARAARERAERLVDDVRALLEVGMAVPADLLGAQERAASARVALIQAESAAAIERSRLASLLQLDPADTFDLADSPAASLPPLPPPLPACREAAAVRPELAALDARLGSLVAREAVARAAARPTVTLAAQWDLARPNVRYFPPADEWHDSWSVGLVAQWLLFDGGRSGADAAAARASERAVEHVRDETRRAIELEVEAAWRALVDGLAAVEAADAAVAAARERQRATAERHAAGLVTTVELLDAEAALAAAEHTDIEVRAGAWLAAAALDRAVGR